MAELMSSGIELMLVGMGIVFLFLAMLVLSINGMSYLVQRFLPEAPATTTQATPTIDQSVIAAITAAIHQHRNKHSS